MRIAGDIAFGFQQLQRLANRCDTQLQALGDLGLFEPRAARAFWLIGVAAVGESVPSTAAIAHAAFASILGALMPFSNAVAAASPFVVGLLYDAQGSYTMAFYGVAVVSIVSAVLLLGAAPPIRDRAASVSSGASNLA